MILYEKRDLAQKSDLLGLIFLPESIISHAYLVNF